MVVLFKNVCLQVGGMASYPILSDMAVSYSAQFNDDKPDSPKFEAPAQVRFVASPYFIKKPRLAGDEGDEGEDTLEDSRVRGTD